MLARGGTFAVIGFGGMVAVPSVALVAGEQSVVGNLVGTWVDLWELMQLHARGRIELRTQVHRLDDISYVRATSRAERSSCPRETASTPPKIRSDSLEADVVLRERGCSRRRGRHV